MIKAAIFDLDGLIIDSESIQAESAFVLFKQLGIELEQGKLPYIPGTREIDNWPCYIKKYSLKQDMRTLMEMRNRLYLDLLKNHLEPMSGVLKLLELLKKKKMKLAVASSSTMKQVIFVLNGLKIRDYFDVIVTGHDMKKGKPFPDIFLETAKKLGVRPECCLVLEDSMLGVEAAKTAGMKAIAVPNKHTKDHDFSKADLVVDSLEKVGWKVVSSI